MATAGGPQEMRNETAINVSGLLKGQVGDTRDFALHLETLVADGDIIARNVKGTVLLTRLRDGVMVTVEAVGAAPLVCVGCLREYDQPFDVSFDEEFRQTVDVRTGLGLGVGPARHAAPRELEQNADLAVLVAQGLQARLEEQLELLLAIELAPLRFGRRLPQRSRRLVVAEGRLRAENATVVFVRFGVLDVFQTPGRPDAVFAHRRLGYSQRRLRKYPTMARRMASMMPTNRKE